MSELGQFLEVLIGAIAIFASTTWSSLVSISSTTILESHLDLFFQDLKKIRRIARATALSNKGTITRNNNNKATMSTTQELPFSAKTLQAIAKPVISVFMVVVPVVITTSRRAYQLFQKLPQNALLFAYGSVFCFFGGTFPTLFAAIQAAEHGGREKVLTALSDLSDEALIVINESKKDDDVDANNDGKKDSEQLSQSEFLAHKTRLVLKKMNPEKIDLAISSMYGVWLSVAAVLSIQFARTIAMALSISDFLKKPIDRFITPIVNVAVPKDYEKWVPVVMSWIVKSIAMAIAWKIQSVMSAFTSALTGGLMMARATYQFCVHRKLNPFGILPEKHTDSNLDEILSYIFSALGFYFQFRNYFSLPFPLNIVLMPFNIAEYYIKWTITSRK